MGGYVAGKNDGPGPSRARTRIELRLQATRRRAGPAAAVLPAAAVPDHDARCPSSAHRHVPGHARAAAALWVVGRSSQAIRLFSLSLSIHLTNGGTGGRGSQDACLGGGMAGE